MGLCAASSCCCETALWCGFHYFREFRSEEGRGSWQKGTCSVFTVNIINRDDLKKKKKEKKRSEAGSDGSDPHGGSIRPQMRPGGPALNNFL